MSPESILFINLCIVILFLLFGSQENDIPQKKEIEQLRARAERAEAALNGLVDAVNYDLRHADSADEDKAWKSLEGIKSALEIAKHALEKARGGEA